MTCPDENVLGELARGDMDPDKRAEVEAHLDECEDCSDVVAELARIFASSFSGSEGSADPEPSVDGMHTIAGDGDEQEPPPWPQDLRLPEGAKLGRYVVLRAIGAGAMGIVYTAYDPELDRKVALKLLRRAGSEASLDPADSQSNRNKRLLREAQALARLAHPHAITVHDVGTWESQVFLAMEFVEGGTLTDWLRSPDGPRPWRQVLRVFREAGEGLAAAHEAGLVHRDFKPDNVLLHRSGRAVVTDFGLARPLGRSGDEELTGANEAGGVAASLRLSGSGSALSETLTQTGALVGTPAYMAPEQLDGRRCDAKSDQFAFCVALYEGLYGERPYKARSLSGLISAIDQGRISPPPRDRDVPRWLRRAVLRGLQVEPEQRYPDIRTLLTALRPKRLGTWRSVVAMGVLSLAAGAGSVAMLRGEAPEPVAYCDDVGSKLQGVWDDAIRDATREAFARSGLTFADDTATRVVTHLDDYAQQWVQAQAETCRSDVEGRDPEAVIAVRMTCLARRRSMLGAMARALGQADGTMVMQSIEAVRALPSPSACADISTLGTTLPAVPEAEREAVAAVRSLIDEAHSLQSLGKVAEGRDKAVEAVAMAEPLEYGPLYAEVKHAEATSLQGVGELEVAEQAMHDALAAAIARDHDRVLTEVAIALAHLEVTRMASPVVVERWVALGLAALDSRGGEHPDQRANLIALRGHAQRSAGDLEGAMETLRGVLALREEHYGVDHYTLTEPLAGLAMALAEAGEHDEAIALIERARAILRENYGEEHPHYWVMLQKLGTVHFYYGYYREALEEYEDAYARFEQGMGKRHPSTAVLAYNIATTLAMVERYDEALVYVTEAQAVEDEIYGAKSRVSASSRSLEGEIYLRAGRIEPALEAMQRGIDIIAEVAPDDVEGRANYDSQMGLALLEAGRLEEAERHLAAALRAQREKFGEPSIEVAESSGRLAMVHLARGKLSEARTMIDASVRQYEATDHDPHQHAEAWFRRARVRAAAGELTQARVDAQRAQATYARLADQPAHLRAVEDWLSAHPGLPGSPE